LCARCVARHRVPECSDAGTDALAAAVAKIDCSPTHVCRMIRFAGCRLDIDARRLFRGAREVHLSPKAFETLKVLVENRPRALSKAELLDRVWPGVFVAETSLARTINEIRERLGPRCARVVRTVHGYGYAFAGVVEDDSGQSSAGTAGRRAICWLTSADREIALHDGRQVAGRDPSSSIWLDSPKVSRRHASFVVEGTTVTVEDLGSKNGTFVGGQRLAGCVRLKQGDQVRLGPFTFAFAIAITPLSTETEVTGPLSRQPL
jgi:DNA-binding winged helix-turn-helix (wHTH) protein